jgi:hypothetical protein
VSRTRWKFTCEFKAAVRLAARPNWAFSGEGRRRMEETPVAELERKIELLARAQAILAGFPEPVFRRETRLWSLPTFWTGASCSPLELP